MSCMQWVKENHALTRIATRELLTQVTGSCPVTLEETTKIVQVFLYSGKNTFVS